MFLPHGAKIQLTKYLKYIFNTHHITLNFTNLLRLGLNQRYNALVMKKNFVLSCIFLFLFFGGMGINLARQWQSEDTPKEIESLSLVLPKAQRFSKKIGQPPHFEAFGPHPTTGEEVLLGLAFVTTDIAPKILGYAGPIKMLVGTDLKGKITNTLILKHSETPSYVVDIPSFLDQFSSLGIKNTFHLGQDLDGISRATITCEAITRAVEKSLKKMARQRLGLEPTGMSATRKNFPWDEIIIPLILFGMAVTGILTYNKKLRWASLLVGLIYFGLIKSTLVSTVQIANIALLKFPSFSQSPLWYMLIGLTLLTTLLFGMVYCGSLCPFATVQELLYNVVRFKKKKIKRPDLSYSLDQRARYGKHIFLWAAIVVSIILGNASAASIEPFLTLFARNGTTLAWILLGLMCVAALFHFRFWCKYLCPVGACLGLIANKSPFKIRLGKECISCDICDRVCPTRAIKMDDTKTPVINYPECILCGKCIEKCPKDTLKIKP